MTPTDIETMTDDQIAEAVAKAMGWSRQEPHLMWRRPDLSHYASDFSPCTDANDALTVLGKLYEITGHRIDISYGSNGVAVGWIGGPPSPVIGSFGRAVCRALLHAVAETEVGDG